MTTATSKEHHDGNSPGPVNIDVWRPVSRTERLSIGRVLRIFPSRPHAYKTGRTGEGPRTPSRNADSEGNAGFEPDNVAPDPAAALSLHVGADILVHHHGHKFFNHLVKNLDSAIVQCMSSHPKHRAYVEHAQQMRDRTTRAQQSELLRRALLVHSVESRNLFFNSGYKMLDGRIVPLDDVREGLRTERISARTRDPHLGEQFQLQRPRNAEERRELYQGVDGADCPIPKAAELPERPASEDRFTPATRACCTRVLYSRDDLPVGQPFGTVGTITARANAGALWEYRVTGCHTR